MKRGVIMIIDIIVIILIIFSAYMGFKKGLVSVLVSLASLILAIFLGFALQGPVSNYLYENTPFGSGIEENVVKIINENAGNGQNKDNNQIINMFNKIQNQEKVNNNISTTIEQFSKAVTMFILKGVSFIIILIVVYIICFILKLVLNIVFDLPLLNVVNKFGGLGINMIQTLAKIWIVFAIIYFVSPIMKTNTLQEIVNKGSISSTLYNNNLFVSIIESNLKI